MIDPIDEILARHGIAGPWTTLESTGVANRIYATNDVVLRIATDHPEAVTDARTESVAAPAVNAAGIPSPRLLTFDDSRTLIDRPYSLWERVHGETLGVFAPDPPSAHAVWREVGRQLARLHSRVQTCLDPRDWLDRPERATNLIDKLDAVLSARLISAPEAAELRAWIVELQAALGVETPSCFLHNDIHAMNVMCTRDGELLAIIDWGDAGWGDPVLELSQVPLAAVGFVLDGYRAESPALLGDRPQARIIWDKIASLLDGLWTTEWRRVEFTELQRYVRDTAVDWRS
jgi:aminoglycoside phosphotransferase (APT) family kinase protein